MSIRIRPGNLKGAATLVAMYHRHNKPPTGARYAIFAECETTGRLAGAVIIGNPVARGLDDEYTAEALRVVAVPGAPKGTCSALLAAAWRSWRAMGGRRMVTYTLVRESGASLRALKGQGWRHDGLVRLRPADSWCNRPGRVAQAVCGELKNRWVVEVTGALGWLTALTLGAGAVAALLGG